MNFEFALNVINRLTYTRCENLCITNKPWFNACLKRKRSCFKWLRFRTQIDPFIWIKWPKISFLIYSHYSAKFLNLHFCWHDCFSLAFFLTGFFHSFTLFVHSFFLPFSNFSIFGYVTLLHLKLCKLGRLGFSRWNEEHQFNNN